VELRKWATKRKGWAPIHSGHHGGGSTGGVEVFPVFTAAALPRLFPTDFGAATKMEKEMFKSQSSLEVH